MKDIINIGYLGPKGTFSQEALDLYIKCQEFEDRKRFCEKEGMSIEQLIGDVASGKLDRAIIPIENSIEGSVNASMDTLAQSNGLLISGELVLPIRQNLLSLPGTLREEISYIASHPQGLGQCRNYLEKYFPGIEKRIMSSTATAAVEVLKDNAGSKGAAIGSRKAAEVYNLEILEADIQDYDHNETRFIIIGRSPAPRTGRDKTSLVFSTEDQPGSLYRILGIFDLWDINLTRIESRPAKNQLGKYQFFVDIEGHSEDSDVADALVMVQRKTSFFKNLGSYPRWNNSP